MDVVGDEIAGIFHTGGIELEGVIVDTYQILLTSGRVIELGEHGVVATDRRRMQSDSGFDRFIGLRIVGVESNEHWPTCGIRLSNGSVLVMGSPAPYNWTLYDATSVPNGNK